METKINFWSYLTLLFLEWEMFRTKVVEKLKIQFYVQKSLPENNLR